MPLMGSLLAPSLPVRGERRGLVVDLRRGLAVGKSDFGTQRIFSASSRETVGKRAFQDEDAWVASEKESDTLRTKTQSLAHVKL